MDSTQPKQEGKQFKAILLTKEVHTQALEAIERESAIDRREGAPMAAILIEEAAKHREAKRSRETAGGNTA